MDARRGEAQDHVACRDLVGGQHRIALDRADAKARKIVIARSEEHTSELQSLMRISYAVFCLKKKKHTNSDLYSTYIHLHLPCIHTNYTHTLAKLHHIIKQHCTTKTF